MQRASQLGERVVRDLTDAAGEGGIIADAAQLTPFLRDWRGLYQGSAPLLLQPSTTAAAARIVSVCARNRIGIVPQGGNTGLVGGAVPDSTYEHPQILLSTARLRAIRQIDPDNYTITAEAGCVLGALQAAAERADRLFPLSLAAEGSCQLGGNISTNAGGTAVLRYGTTRDLVLGLEVVLPDGRIYEGLRGLRKDNTGYDLKQLFIGAEGTLGLITAATCKLFPRYSSIATAFAAVPDVDAAIALHRLARQRLGEDLTTFEFMDRRSLDLVVRHIPGCRNPLDAAYGWYVLIETAPVRAAADADGDLEALLQAAMSDEVVLDAVLASAGAQRDQFWRIRHGISEAQRLDGPSIKHDISVPVSAMSNFIAAASATVSMIAPGAPVVAFGHLGDGNVHFNVAGPDGVPAADFLGRWQEISDRVCEIAIALGGSFSAEHGIGRLKVHELERWRGGANLELMRTVKAAIDPLGIMNPGKLFAQP